MADDIDDLKAAMDAATPVPDAARKAANLALAEKNFADLQGSLDAVRPTPQNGPLGAILNGVGTMLNVFTTRAGLTATTALVAVGMIAVLPNMEELMSPTGVSGGLTATTDAETRNRADKAELAETEQPVVSDDALGSGTILADRDTDAASVDMTTTLGVRDEQVAEAPVAVEEMLMEEADLAAPALEAESFAGGASRAQTSVQNAPVLHFAPSPTSPAVKRLAAPSDIIVHPEGNTEEFANAPDGPLKVTTEDPVSTFSIDVDTAAYSVVRSSLMSGRLPPREAVRVEEMINYFNYAYPAPDGPHPFEPTITVTPSPWNAGTDLVHIGIQGTLPAVEDRPPLNLVFLIDTSGSMQDANKLPLLKQSFRLMLSELRPEDEVSIVTYAGSAGQVLEPTRAAERSTILSALDRLEAGGSTAGQAGLQQAYQVAEGMAGDGEVTRVILATDGDFNVGLSDPDALKDFIADKRDSGTYLSVLGFGRGNLDDATMQALAQNGNGQAAYIDTLSEAQKVLVDQLTGALFPIANDVKIQVEFNPTQIAEYRLIGYETRALNREDFANDKVDAGDIGAGHRVTAIYEVTPVGSDAIRNGPLRYTDAEVAEASEVSSEYGYFKLRYKMPGEATSILIEEPIEADSAAPGEDVRFSIAMAGFGELLRGGTYLGNWSWDDAIALANGARGEDAFGYRAEAVKLMRLAESLDR